MHTVRGRLLGGLLLAASAASAQRPGAPPKLVDRIVAVVGGTPILYSQVEEQFAMIASSGGTVPEDSAGRASMRRDLLDRMVEEELLVQQAGRDTSVKVTEQEVQDQVEKTVQNVRQQFSSDLDFTTQLHNAGFSSEEEWRRWLADHQRRSILQQRLIEGLRVKGKLRPVPPTDAEMRDYWNSNQVQRPKHPPQISYKQVLIAAVPDSAAAATALALAESLKNVLRHGGNFPEIAKVYSADSVSRVQGGELGWFRRGVMYKSFEDAAFRLKPGQISDVVASPAGYHVIQSERVQPAEIQVRHILIQPVISPAQLALARRLADSVHAAIAAGAPIEALARRYGDPEATVTSEAIQVAQLPADYAKALAGDTVPGLVPPFEVDANTGRPKFAVVQVTKWEPAGELTFEDVKERMRDQLSQQLAVKHYLEALRRKTYVDIRL
jgi:peptidyl-prolyl cis-trans isomerase SurA